MVAEMENAEQQLERQKLAAEQEELHREACWAELLMVGPCMCACVRACVRTRLQCAVKLLPSAPAGLPYGLT
eukprot:873337-Pelagomonas_calceolata.AAC.4